MKSSPLSVTASVATGYAIWLIWLLAGHGILDAANVGQRFVDRSDTSPAIEAVRSESLSTTGYDGQFVLFIALDPANAWEYTDAPAYRYGRALLPLAARAVSVGNADVIPYAIVLLNYLGLLGGTFALAVLLRRNGASPWWACLFGAFPGLFFAFTKDLTEPAAYGIIAIAALAFDTLSGRRRAVAVGALAGLAGVTRETAIVFGAAFAAAVLLDAATPRRRRILNSGLLLALSALPYLMLRTGLHFWLSDQRRSSAANDSVASMPSDGGQPPLTLIPFRGLIDDFPFGRPEVEQIMTVVLPAGLALVLGLLALRLTNGWLAALLLNVLAFVLWLPPGTWATYTASGRATTGVVVATVCCVPALHRRGLASGLWCCVVLWMMPWYWLLPVSFGR